MKQNSMTANDLKVKLQSTIDKTGFTTFGDAESFLYDPSKPVKCDFSLVLDHTLWGKFCELGEELATSPTLLLYLLMEQTLITTGKLEENWKEDSDKEPSSPIVVEVKDLKQDKNGEFLSLGQNKILGIPEDRKPTKRRTPTEKQEDEGDEEEALEMNFLAELN